MNRAITKKRSNQCPTIAAPCDFSRFCFGSIQWKKSYLQHYHRIRSLNFGDLFLEEINTREIAKKEYVDLSKLKKCISDYERDKFKVFCYSQTGTLYPKFLQGEHKFIIIAYKNEKIFRLFWEYENSRQKKELCGILLGYPHCCVMNAIKERRGNPIHLDFRWKTILFPNKENYICPLINPVHNLFLHIPCSNTCYETIKIAQCALEYIQTKLGSSYVKAYFCYVKRRIAFMRRKTNA